MTRTRADREQARRPVRSGPVITCVSEREMLPGQLPGVKSIRSADSPRPTRTVATICGGNRP